MNMSLFDWGIVFSMLTFLAIFCYRTRKFTQNTTDFLAANRCAGRYLIGISEGMASLGAVSIIGAFQMGYKAGLGATWWANIGLPVTTIMFISGWVLYRYRQTKVLTMAQFFEIRYSKKFRVFAGSLCFLAGIINFGIFPAIGANFFINFCGLPNSISVVGFGVPTYPLITMTLISIAVYFTLIGGQITVLISDFLQAMLCNIVLVTILIFLLFKFGLSNIISSLLIASEGHSMVNPFNSGHVDGFDPWYFIIVYGGMFYTRLAWQGNQGYNCSAKSPHEAKMGGVVGQLRGWAFMFSLTLLPLVAYMIMHNPDYANQAAGIKNILAGISNNQVRDQMITPIAMTTFLPAGFMGAFVTVMFAAFITTHDTYLHSWGSILIQDVIMPLRKSPFSPQKHLFYLRLSVVGVGIFIFMFSLFFRQTQHILIFFLLTGSIWLGGSGIVIIGGLYWKRGTISAAYTALIVGGTLAVTGIVLDQVWKNLYDINFPIDGKWISVISMTSSILVYIIVSLLFGGGKEFNLDKMLHRGKYALDNEGTSKANTEKPSKWKLKSLLGITEEFTLWDKLLYGVIWTQTFVLFGLFIFMILFALIVNLSEEGWAQYHYYVIGVQIVISFGLAVWFTVGGFRDLMALFLMLNAAKRDNRDDGTVVDHQNLSDIHE